ncbi:MAG: sugar ABC transporter permease [Treponema sp.]|jgi:ABC-type sugar transport system permease subunit|nr:sugar ABC transporter permease [Treponema sp.]
MKSKAVFKENIEWYLLVLIPVLGTVGFSLIPLFMTISDSTRNMSGNYVGFLNYSILFKDIEFRQSVGNTVYMGVLGMFLNIPLAFVLATMLNNIKRGKSFFKTCFLLPMIMSMVTVSLLFKFLFSADPNSIANSVLHLFSIAPKGFFNDPAMSRESVIFMSIWKGIGYNVILFFAGLQTLPKEYYEAAQIDGANEFQQWFRITIPCMKNIFTFVYITTAITVLKRFTDVYAISNEFGSPAGSLFTIMLFVFRKTFSTRWAKDLGLGSAASTVLFLFIIMITIINLYITENDDERGKSRRRFRIKSGGK